MIQTEPYAVSFDEGPVTILEPGDQPTIAQFCLGIYYTPGDGGIVKELKTVSVSFRVSPRFKRALELAAASVNRTQTNLLETLVFEYCDAHGINIEPPQGGARMGGRESE